MAFSPDGHTLATGDSYGTIRLWDVADPAHPRPLGHPLTGTTPRVGGVQPRRAHAGQRRVDGTVQLWDVTDPAHPRPLGQPQTGTTPPEVGGVQPRRAHAGQRRHDGTIRLWDVTDPAHPRPLSRIQTGGTTSSIVSVAFSPDGHTLATSEQLRHGPVVGCR